MAHFAKLDENNVVLDVIVLDDADAAGGVYPNSDAAGSAYLKRLTGHSNWKQTSYNKKFRVNFAAKDGTYDPELDAFLPFKPYASWVLTEDLSRWIPPVVHPGDDVLCYWDEESLSWINY